MRKISKLMAHMNKPLARLISPHFKISGRYRASKTWPTIVSTIKQFWIYVRCKILYYSVPSMNCWILCCDCSIQTCFYVYTICKFASFTNILFYLRAFVNLWWKNIVAVSHDLHSANKEEKFNYKILLYTKIRLLPTRMIFQGYF